MGINCCKQSIHMVKDSVVIPELKPQRPKKKAVLDNSHIPIQTLSLNISQNKLYQKRTKSVITSIAVSLETDISKD